MRSHRLWTKKQRMPLLTISKVNMFWNCLNFAVSLLFFYTCTWIKYHCCRRCSRRAGLLCFAEEWAVGSRNRKDPRSPDGGQTSAIVPAREEESLLCMEVSDSLGHPCLCSDQTSVCSNDAPLLFSTRSTPKACHQKTAPTSLPTRYHPSAIKGKSAVWDHPCTLESRYTWTSCCSQKLLRSPRKPTRKISKIPFKVLDAPELQDDFYLNLVDWSALNMLSVGLGTCVYLWSACTSQVPILECKFLFVVAVLCNSDSLAKCPQVTRLCDLSVEGDSVTSVGWSERVSTRSRLLSKKPVSCFLLLRRCFALCFRVTL